MDVRNRKIKPLPSESQIFFDKIIKYDSEVWYSNVKKQFGPISMYCVTACCMVEENKETWKEAEGGIS